MVGGLFTQAEKSSVSNDVTALQLQQLTDENTALLDAKVTAEKASATLSSQVYSSTCTLWH